jgi:hypothetical protein
MKPEKKYPTRWVLSDGVEHSGMVSLRGTIKAWSRYPWGCLVAGYYVRVTREAEVILWTPSGRGEDMLPRLAIRFSGISEASYRRVKKALRNKIPEWDKDKVPAPVAELKTLYFLSTMVEGYIDCALWSSKTLEGEPMDDFEPSEAFKVSARKDCEDFLDLLAEVKVDYRGITPTDMGHDFWLTRNRHGAGFWDRGLGNLGDVLTKWAHTFGSVDLYINGEDEVEEEG